MNTMHGHTFLEIIVVITITSILVMVAAIKMPSLSSMQNQSTADSLSADLSLTKILSMSTNQPYHLTIGKSAYQIQDQNGVAVANPETQSISVTYPNGTTITPMVTLMFDSMGKPYVITPATGTTALTASLGITVKASDASQVITVIPQTGFIQ